jgi:hypothetical protein
MESALTSWQIISSYHRIFWANSETVGTILFTLKDLDAFTNVYITCTLAKGIEIR